MSKTILRLLLIVLLIATAAGQPKKHAAAGKPVAPSVAASCAVAGCDESLWDHVYHPKRLKIIQKCIAVTGTIRHLKREADGDDHIQLELDQEYKSLTNSRNDAVQHGSLVIEPICQYPAQQADAIMPCRDFHSDVELPKKGDHVKVLGSYVWDSEAGHGWMEIHPVTSITTVK